MDRKALRAFLLQKRTSLDAREYAHLNTIVSHAIKAYFGFLTHTGIGLYWPYKNEFDIGATMAWLHQAGNTVSLPRVDKSKQPLVFMRWWPGVRMKQGKLGIPFPLGPIELPEILFIPLVGFDARGYRLGYGGGYYDITLHARAQMPIRIGVGFELGRVKTIQPEPHDIPMEFLVTEKGIRYVSHQGVEWITDQQRLKDILLDLMFFRFQRQLMRSSSSPVCFANPDGSFQLI